MEESTEYATKTELNTVKQALEKVTIRVEVLTNDVHQLTNHVADLAEDLGEFRVETNARFDRLEAAIEATRVDLTALAKTVADGNAALMSAILQLARP